MDQVKNSSPPRIRHNWSWRVRRDVDEEIGASNVHLLDPERGLRVLLHPLAVRIQELLLSHLSEVERLRVDGIDESLDILVE